MNALTEEAMTYDEACAMLRCKRTKLKELVRHGIIVKANAIGKIALVTRTSVERKLAEILGVKAPRRGSRRVKSQARPASAYAPRPVD